MPIEFVQSIPPAAQRTALQSVELRPGLRLEATVQAGRSGPLLQFAGGQIPLEPGHALAPGQRVQIEVLAREPVLSIRVTALETASTAPAPQGTQAPWLALLRQLGVAEGALGKAAALLPPALRASEAATRQILTLFLQQQGLSVDLSQLLGLLNRLEQGGGPIAGFIRNAAAALMLFQVTTPADLPEVIRRMRNDTLVEARLKALVGGAPASDALADLGGLRRLIAELSGHGGLLAAARDAGVEGELKELLRNLEQRLLGGALQSARNPDSPYSFVQVPFAPGSGVEYLYLHMMPDKAAGGDDMAASHSVVLDMALTRLGAMWIALQTAKGHCNCVFKCRNTESVAHLTAAAPEMQAGLERHFKTAAVRVQPWTEDYLETLGKYLSTLERLDLNA